MMLTAKSTTTPAKALAISLYQAPQRFNHQKPLTSPDLLPLLLLDQ